MSKLYKITIILSLMFISGLVQSCTQENNNEEKVRTIWLIGDSTVTDYSKSNKYIAEKYPKTGWGQMFQELLIKERLTALNPWLDADSVFVDNRAVGGRSTRTFFQEGRWRAVYDSLKSGDLVLIQFGHNDASLKKPLRYVDLEGYSEFLRLYITQSREKGARPILVTPVARNYPWENEQLHNCHGEYPATMKTIAKEMNTELIDLTELSMKFFSEKGKSYVSEYYFMNLPANTNQAFPDGENDNTHFQPEGASEVALLVYNALSELANNKLETE